MRTFVGIVFLFYYALSNAYGQSNTYYHVDKLTHKVRTSSDSILHAKHLAEAYVFFNMNGYNGLSPKDTVEKRNGTHYYFDHLNHFTKIELIQINEKRNNYTVNRTYFETFSSIDKKIKELENNGFPFASIQITDQNEQNELLKLTYKIDSGDYVIIDKINIKSKNDFHEKTVLGLIDLKVGEQYNEQKIKNVGEIIANEKIYTLLRPIEVIFRKGKAELFVYIDKKKSSNADGYVGFQQDRITNKLVLNGYINLQLKNALNRAETIELNWRNSPTKTQDLKAKFEYPYIMGSPIGIGSQIDLQKQDSSFIRSNIQFELIFRNPTFRVSLFDQIESSSTISSEPIPGFRDYSKNTVGLSVGYKPFMPDYLSFYHPKVELIGGIFNYRADTLNDQQNQTSNRKYFAAYSHKIDFLKFFHLNNELSYQGLSSSLDLARNEFIYFGGLQSIRGFYELELAGKSIWSLQNEIEFTPFPQLALKVIYDYSNFINQQKNYTHSFGFGFGLINNNSQLDIIVANGKLNNNPFLISETKVHIGFKSNF